MVDISSIIEGTVKFRDGKKWKSRWCVMRKLSPVADCLHLQLYRDSKDRYKQGQTKASLSLQHFLGAETGFTLDKESNTVAIICQDVIVVLAFDTRERLIQWQVKIAGHLGDDQQYLVLVSSAPSKAKVTSGPARMHVQDGRFCLTTGVPPKLAGLWEIGNLRRYGVVDGRFCFEGGSLCGKGEGLYILLTDQGEDITHSLKMAAQGKLTTRRRTTLSRKLAGLESPRKTATIGHNASRCQDESCTCASTGGSPSYWPSQESQGGPAMMHHHQHHELDCNYGCGDTVSVSDMQDSSGGMHNETWACGDTGNNIGGGMMGGNIGLERCMSCISKLGAPTMSRSSTVTTSGGATPGADQAFSPGWGDRVCAQQQMQQHHMNRQQHQQQLSLPPQNPGDRSSLCSHGSSSGNSEYSVPRCANGSCQNDASSSWYERIPAPSNLAGISPIPKAGVVCQCGCQPPLRPPKPVQMAQAAQNCASSVVGSPTRRPKPPMPLPIAPMCTQMKPAKPIEGCGCRAVNNSKVGPYENYDTPKIPIPVESKTPDPKTPDLQRCATLDDEYYDTPKRLKESLAACGSTSASPDQFGNYDTPPSLMMGGTCLLKITKMNDKNQEETIRVAGGTECPCQRVMSWADNWIPLGYCRRGYGMENTALNYSVKVNGEGRMPLVVTQPCADSAIYATVDKSKKLNRRNTVDCACTASQMEKDISSNYENIEPISGNNKSGENSQHVDNANYANIEFAQSLEHYENAKGVLRKAGITAEELQALQNDGICNKCGHAREEPSELSASVQEEETAGSTSTTAGDDYLMMEPSGRTLHGRKTAGFPGYIPMSPAQGFTTKTELLKQRVCRLMSGEKSASNPALTAVGPAVDRSRKRSESEMRVPGSAMMLHQVYSRRQLMDSGDSLTTKAAAIAGQLARKRSSSADSSRYLEDVEEFSAAGSSLSSPSSETLRKSSIHSLVSHEEDDGRRSSSPCLLHREVERPCCTDTTKTPDETVNIRRSSSVPCKSGQNRDSSSSNDSGVSTGSLKQREFELESAGSPTTARRRRLIGGVGGTARIGSVRGPNNVGSCVTQPPRRSRSFDPLGEMLPQQNTGRAQAKSSSAEAEIPICTAVKGIKGYGNGGDATALGPPYMDSRSTSSGTSDMSDYIETLSLSSHSSSDAPDSLRPGGARQPTTTLRPRSGKEYQNLDRAALISSAGAGAPGTAVTAVISASYANITPVPESPRESPSPGYMSGSSPTNGTPTAGTPTNTVLKNKPSMIQQQPMQ